MVAVADVEYSVDTFHAVIHRFRGRFRYREFRESTFY